MRIPRISARASRIALTAASLSAGGCTQWPVAGSGPQASDDPSEIRQGMWASRRPATVTSPDPTAAPVASASNLSRPGPTFYSRTAPDPYTRVTSSAPTFVARPSVPAPTEQAVEESRPVPAPTERASVEFRPAPASEPRPAVPAANAPGSSAPSVHRPEPIRFTPVTIDPPVRAAGAPAPSRTASARAESPAAPSAPPPSPRVAPSLPAPSQPVLDLPLVTDAPPAEESSAVTQVSFATVGADFDPDVSRDGRLLVFASTQHQANADIYVKSVTSRVVTQLTSDPARDAMPKFSPDGSRIAFCSDRGGNWDIYVMPVGGGNPVQVTDTPTHELHPSWSPDGTQLVYCRLGDVSGQWELWVTDALNSGVAHSIGYGLFPNWCPARGGGEGGMDRIVFQRSRQRGDRAFSVWTIDYRDGRAGNPTEVATINGFACINPAWSPDGRWIVFAAVPTLSRRESAGSTRPASSDLWMADLTGGARVKLTSGPALSVLPSWGPDGRVFFVSDRGGLDNIWSLSAAEAVRLAAGTTPHEGVANVPDHNAGGDR